MKALVLYRSFYGNTKLVAETIGQTLRELGHEAIVQDVRQRLPDLGAVDAVFNGSPTRIKRPSGRSLRVLKRLRSAGFAGKPVAIFDTCATLPATPEKAAEAEDWIVPGAAGILQKTAATLGLNVYRETLRCEVQGMKGPLAADVFEKTVAFTKAFVAEFGKR